MWRSGCSTEKQLGFKTGDEDVPAYGWFLLSIVEGIGTSWNLSHVVGELLPSVALVAPAESRSAGRLEGSHVHRTAPGDFTRMMPSCPDGHEGGGAPLHDNQGEDDRQRETLARPCAQPRRLRHGLPLGAEIASPP